ncbi:MAG: polymer-forming cytoskeletal protein [Alphaproteobacteria bacterium]|nr:polymer-forming cytoskeletal protein [Alphaproteobacteria bacterium]
MFSRSKSNQAGTDAPAAPAPVAPAPNGKQRGAVRTAPSIISPDLTFVGTIVSSGDIQIDGKIEGEIRTTSLTIGEKALVQGDIFAEEVTVRGKVIGTIRGRRVQLSSTCHVEGTILHEALAVEAGAFFEGHCRHSGDPLNEMAAATPAVRPQLVAPAPAPAAQPAPVQAAPEPTPAPQPQATPVILKQPAVQPITLPKAANGLYPKSR